jgi:hypothetical protein
MSDEEKLIDEIVEKTEKLKALGLDMNTVKRLLVENFKILDNLPNKIGDFGTKYEVLKVAESGVKLQKLKILKGIKPFGSVAFGEKKIKCQYFILDNDCYIKHMDYFSPSMTNNDTDFCADLNTLCNKYIGKSRSKKFIYEDAWGDILLQRKAWIKIANFVFACDNMHQIKLKNLIISLQEDYHATYMRKNELVDSNFDRFWESLINDYSSKAKKPLSDDEQWQIYMDGLHYICSIMLTQNNLKRSIEQCKEVMMIWSLEQTEVTAIMNKKGFPMFFDDVIREVYKEMNECNV